MRDTVLLAALARALVDTASDEWRDGVQPADVPSSMLRLASWQAARDGVDGSLLDPASLRPRPAEEVRPALTANDDVFVEQRLAEVLKEGNGATRQRAALEKTGSMLDVVADIARVTAGLDS